MTSYAPIVLFTYSRLNHLRETVKALRENREAPDSDLIVYSDGWKTERDRLLVEEVRGYVREIDGFRSVKIKEREKNYGLATNIISGVTEMIDRHGRVIVLEDDLVTSPWFLSYMNKGLQVYETVDRVISIHGYCYPTDHHLPPTYFIKGADCLGWATWKRGWDLFEQDGRKLIKEIEARKLIREFDFGDSYPYAQMLRDQTEGRNSSWAVRWYASAFLRDKLTLYPGRTLVSHIGYDGGTHATSGWRKPETLATEEIVVTPIEVRESGEARDVTAKYLKRLHGGPVKMTLRSLKGLARRITGSRFVTTVFGAMA